MSVRRDVGPAIRPDEPIAWSTPAVGRLLAASAVRFHPSPYVEERLAVRLARAAAAPGAERPEARLVAFPGVALRLDGRGSARGLIVGGAICSGVSLAGAAFLAWRRGPWRHGAAARPGASWLPGRRAAG